VWVQLFVFHLHRSRQSHHRLRVGDESRLPKIDDHGITLLVTFLEQNFISFEVVVEHTSLVNMIKRLYNVL